MDGNNAITKVLEKSYGDLIQSGEAYIFNLTEENRSLDKYAGMNVLGDYCYISKGMVLNSDEKKAKSEFKKEDLISETEDTIHCRKFLEGKDCGKYTASRIRYLEYDTARVPDKCSRPTFRELYTTPKLMFNRLGDLQVFFDEKGDFTTSDAMFVCLLWKDLHGVENNSIASSIKKFSTRTRAEMETLSAAVDLRYLLAIMNSRYASVLLANIRGDDFNTYPEYVRSVPIPPTTPEQQKPLIDLADKMLALNADAQKKVSRFVGRMQETYKLGKVTQNIESFYKLPFADFVKELEKQKVKLTMRQKDELEDYFDERAQEIAALRKQIAATDARIDALVYALYGLSEKEIALVEKSQ